MGNAADPAEASTPALGVQVAPFSPAAPIADPKSQTPAHGSRAATPRRTRKKSNLGTTMAFGEIPPEVLNARNAISAAEAPAEQAAPITTRSRQGTFEIEPGPSTARGTGQPVNQTMAFGAIPPAAVPPAAVPTPAVPTPAVPAKRQDLGQTMAFGAIPPAAVAPAPAPAAPVPASAAVQAANRTIAFGASPLAAPAAAKRQTEGQTMAFGAFPPAAAPAPAAPPATDPGPGHGAAPPRQRRNKKLGATMAFGDIPAGLAPSPPAATPPVGTPALMTSPNAAAGPDLGSTLAFDPSDGSLTDIQAEAGRLQEDLRRQGQGAPVTLTPGRLEAADQSDAPTTIRGAGASQASHANLAGLEAAPGVRKQTMIGGMEAFLPPTGPQASQPIRVPTAADPAAPAGTTTAGIGYAEHLVAPTASPHQPQTPAALGMPVGGLQNPATGGAPPAAAGPPQGAEQGRLALESLPSPPSGPFPIPPDGSFSAPTAPAGLAQQGYQQGAPPLQTPLAGLAQSNAPAAAYQGAAAPPTLRSGTPAQRNNTIILVVAGSIILGTILAIVGWWLWH